MISKSLFVLPLALALAAVSLSSQAGSLYVGGGYPGAAFGFSEPLTGSLSSFSFRGELAGGIRYKASGQRNGVDYDGTFKNDRFGTFLDWYPLSNGFRLSAGATFNDTNATLNGRGTGNSTINGKAVDLTGETFNVKLTYPKTTPYVGIGWGHHSDSARGIGFFADIGAQFGRVSTEAQTSLIGKFGITQADVDAEATTVRDYAKRAAVLPTLNFGATYKF